MEYQNIEAQYEALIEYAVSESFKSAYKAAEEVFVSDGAKHDLLGFTEWFIFNFDIIERGQTIAELYAQEQASGIGELLSKSYRSVFKVTEENETLYLRDIFTGDTLAAGHDLSYASGLLNARVLQMEEKLFLIGDVIEMDESFEESIRKAIFELYNKTCSDQALIKLDAFIKRESRMFYNLSAIITETLEENALEENYAVYESIFAYKCSYDELIDLLLKMPYSLQADEDDDRIYKLINEEGILAEIEIETKTFSVLCLTEEMLSKLVEILSEIDAENVVFVKRHMLTIDELL